MGRKSKALPARKATGIQKAKKSTVAKAVKVKAKEVPSKVAKKAALKVVAPLAAVEKVTPSAVKMAAVKMKAAIPVTKPVAVAPQAQIEKAKAALKTAVKEEKSTSKSRAKKLAIEASANESAAALAQKWANLYKKSEQIESKPYNMKAVFEEKTAIVHKVLGWGYILTNRNDRLEVLFKDGIKYLISNYKP